MDNFEFHPFQEMSSTIQTNHSLFDSVSTTALRNEMFGNQVSRDFSAIESYFSPTRNSIGPSSPRGLTKNVFDDMLNQRLHAIRSQEAVLRQRELNMKAKELELSHREQLLIERERSLFEKQMEFQKKQHMMAKTVIHHKPEPAYCTIEPRRSISPDYMEPLATTETDTDMEQYIPVMRQKKRKSLLSIFGFRKSSKDDNKRRMKDVVPTIKGVVQEIMVSDLSEKWTPETKRAAYQLLTQMNADGNLDLSRTVNNSKGFRRGKKGRKGSIRVYV